jgi:hypothetical protein
VYPRIFSYALDEDITIQSFISAPSLESVFTLPLSNQAFEELQQVHSISADLQLSDEDQDVRSFPWGSSQFMASRFYKFIFQRLPKDPAINSIWNSRALPKMKVFDWLLFMDRLNKYKRYDA